jgi:hypothetical protein
LSSSCLISLFCFSTSFCDSANFRWSSSAPKSKAAKHVSF